MIMIKKNFVFGCEDRGFTIHCDLNLGTRSTEFGVTKMTIIDMLDLIEELALGRQESSKNEAFWTLFRDKLLDLFIPEAEAFEWEEGECTGGSPLMKAMGGMSQEAHKKLNAIDNIAEAFNLKFLDRETFDKLGVRIKDKKISIETNSGLSLLIMNS